MSKLYVLHEHAAGYALFFVKEFEEISMFLPQVESSVTDISKFNSIVSLQGFSPFKTAIAALENINAISEGIVPQDLLVFLDDFFAKLKKKKCTLGIADAKLGAAITESIGVQCSHFGVVPEVLRGIRAHFHKLVKGFTDRSASVAQLGLSHSYSRSKIKFNVHNVDNMIIQSIALLDQLDKDLNTFAMRIREWYSYHFPELIKIVPDNFLYAKCAEFIKDRKTLTQDKLDALEEIVMDSAKAQAIIDASKMSMGMDISIVDLINIEMFAKRVVSLGEYRQKLVTYLHNKMGKVAPNLQSLLGDQVSARLISNAGSLTNLAKFPASTVQILGAEKALFRALKTRSNTPKYGLLYHSSFIGRAALKNKGRIARFLANKCSIASRIDCFIEQPTNVFGQKLKEQVENRLKFYESGEVPAKNIDVMREAMQEAKEEVDVAEAKAAKKKNKKKKLAEQQQTIEEEAVAKPNGQINAAEEEETTADVNGASKKKNKKKKKKNLEEQQEQAMEQETAKPNGNLTVDAAKVAAVSAGADENAVSKKKNKKKRKLEQQQAEAEEADVAKPNGNLTKTHVVEEAEGEANAVQEAGEEPKKKKKKKNKNKNNAE